MSAANLKCSRSVGFCVRMMERLNNDVNARQKGLNEIVVTNMETGTSRTIGVAFRTGAKDRGLMLNVCPWCREEILWDKADETPADQLGAVIALRDAEHLERMAISAHRGGDLEGAKRELEHASERYRDHLAAIAKAGGDQ